MSRDPRKPYGMAPRDRDRDRDRDRWLPAQYARRSRSRKRSRSRSPPMRRDIDSGRARSPRRNDKDVLDENILSEISKLPEPSELWEPTQNQEANFGNAPPPPPAFRAEVSSENNMIIIFLRPTVFKVNKIKHLLQPGNPNYPNYQPSYSGIYDDFPSAPSQIPPEIASWNQMSLPPPPAPAPAVFVSNIEDQIKKEGMSVVNKENAGILFCNHIQ